MKKLLVELDDKTKQKLDIQSKKVGKTLKEIVTLLIEHYLKGKDPK